MQKLLDGSTTQSPSASRHPTEIAHIRLERAAVRAVDRQGYGGFRRARRLSLLEVHRHSTPHRIASHLLRHLAQTQFAVDRRGQHQILRSVYVLQHQIVVHRERVRLQDSLVQYQRALRSRRSRRSRDTRNTRDSRHSRRSRLTGGSHITPAMLAGAGELLAAAAAYKRGLT